MKQEIHYTSQSDSNSLQTSMLMLIVKGSLYSIPPLAILAAAGFWIFTRAGNADIERVEREARNDRIRIEAKLNASTQKMSGELSKIYLEMQRLRLDIRGDVRDSVRELMQPIVDKTTRLEKLIDKEKK